MKPFSLWRCAITLATMVGVVALVPTTAAAPAALRASTSTTYTWPELHNSPDLSGTSADPAITSSNASTLGVHWMSPVGGTESSPVVAWNAALNEPLAYMGNAAGYFNAINAQTGAIVWSKSFSSGIVSTPIVDGTSVWVAPQSSGHIYKLNAATGAQECSGQVQGAIQATPVIATPTGGSETIYIGSFSSGVGPVYAFDTATCSQVFAFTDYTDPGTGMWSPLSYNVDANGEPLVLFGTADPDSSFYAIDAVTGALVWTYDTDNPPGKDWDVGAGVDSTAPGVNGFAGGVAYGVGKNGICYAMNLTTGALIWSFDFGQGVSTNSLSTPALAGTTLVFGNEGGIYALDALNGTVLWRWTSGGDTVNSSAAIVGPAGDQVVAFGTLGGWFHVLSLTTGALLYSYQTGAFITASPADFDGTFLVTSDDGFLYDFGLGGGNGAAPSTAVTSPATLSTVANPNGSLTVSGTATAAAGATTGPHGVKAVTISVQQGGTTGPWYHGSDKSFSPGLSFADATLAHQGAKQTDWSISIPVPLDGGSYLVEASAVDKDGIADGSSVAGKPGPSVSNFTVESSPNAPKVIPSAARVAPGGTISVSATGFVSGETVAFTLPGKGGTTKTLGTAKATKSGAVGPIKSSVPANEPFGPQTITATGGTSDRAGATSIVVSNNSPQLGYTPQRFGFEPNDTVISMHQAVGASYFSPAWSFDASGAIDTPPAVDLGVAYFGDALGDFYAVSVSKGTSLWHESIGSAIDSSPAVDKGDVFFGDKAGSVVALNASTGAPVWSTPLKGSVNSSPAVSGGVVYIVSQRGIVSALSETTGAIAWSRSLGAKTEATLSVDPTQNLIAVGDRAGKVVALSSTSGAILWSHGTGAAIVAAPTFSGGLVLIGSTNGTFYALNESNGQIAWTQTTGGAITAAAVVTPGGVGVGSADGNIYNINLSGHLQSTQPIGSPIVGITATVAITIVSTSAGLSLVRGAGGLRPDWGQSAPGVYKSSVVILNGEVFAAGTNGVLRTFVIPGHSVY